MFPPTPYPAYQSPAASPVASCRSLLSPAYPSSAVFQSLEAPLRNRLESTLGWFLGASLDLFLSASIGVSGGRTHRGAEPLLSGSWRAVMSSWGAAFGLLERGSERGVEGGAEGVRGWGSIA